MQDKSPGHRPGRVPVYRVALVRERDIVLQEAHIWNSQAAADDFREYLGDVPNEHFMLMMLNRKNRVIGILTIATGSIDAAVVHPRSVFQPAVIHNASHIIVGHNHPGGDPDPAREDLRLTRQLADAATLLDLKLHDHLIIGNGTEAWVSLAERGHI